MRLDKYLKVSRLIKRRTVANEAFGNKSVRAEVLVVTDTSRKEEAKEMFRYL